MKFHLLKYCDKCIKGDMMDIFGLIEPYPLVEPNPTQWDRIAYMRDNGMDSNDQETIDFINGKNTKIVLALKTIKTPIELLKEVVNTKSHKFPNLLHDKLKQCYIYKSAVANCPNLKNVPNIHTYRVKYSKAILSGVNKEIQRHCKYLAKNQIIFHGGVWPASSELKIGSVFQTNRPISTSLCPEVAYVHSKYHNGGQIWVITISKERLAKAYIFKTTGNQKSKHEYEILLEEGLNFKCTSLENMNKLTVVYIDVV